MGRELKRVPLGFDLPLDEVWFGFVLDAIPCPVCIDGKWPNKVTNGFKRADGTWHTYESEYCPVCGGEGNAYPKIEVPEGPGYQMWETVSEGSPVSPTFAAPEELARWLVENDTSITRDSTYEQWLAMITGGGYAPSMVFTPGTGMTSGVAGLNQPTEGSHE